MTSIDLSKSPTMDAAGGTITFGPSVNVRVRGSKGTIELSVPEWAASHHVELWCGPATCLAVGLKSGVILAIAPSEGTIAPIGRLTRLDLSGKYDPGGLERIEFHDLRDGTVLIEHERGIARVASSDGILWEHVHDDLTARVAWIGADSVTVQAETWELSLQLADGTARL